MICYIGLGANLGNCALTLRRAIELIKKIPAVKLLKVSSFYETEPWGVTGQPNFINAAIKISTVLEPLKLLDELQRIELELGRIRREHWGSRTIDLDILLIDGREISSERLTVPHKFLFARDFALVPLKEIFPPLNAKLNGDKISRVTGSPIDFKFKLVACVDKNFGLGLNGKLLFKIPADLKNFRRLTLGHTIIFGRRTLATFPNQQPLDGRRNIILSRTLKNFDGAEVVGSCEELFKVLDVAQENFVIGGQRDVASNVRAVTAQQSNSMTAFNPCDLTVAQENFVIGGQRDVASNVRAVTAQQSNSMTAFNPCDLTVAQENFVIGGAQIFNELIPYAAEIFLTVVNAEVQADTFFPAVDEFTLRGIQTFSRFEIRRYTR